MSLRIARYEFVNAMGDPELMLFVAIGSSPT